MTTQVRPLRGLPAIIPEPTRFDQRRQAAAIRASLEYAGALTKQAKDRLAKAESLFNTASASEPNTRAQLQADALLALQEAYAELAEILVEFR